MGAGGARAIVLFDGVCNFCNDSVLFIIDRDPTERFVFASLQSDAGRRLLAEHGLSDLPVSTMLLIEDGRVLLRSDAALGIARHLSGPWPLVSALRVVPRPLRDAAYTLFARNRYRLFGKSEQCRVPDGALRARFLDLQ